MADGQPDATITDRRPRPIRWLILCGVLLIAGIAIGTAIMVNNFRQRAIANSERELENTVLLLARHFDQQFDELSRIQKRIIEQIDPAVMNSRGDFDRAMSARDIHLLLRSNIGALSYVSGLNLFNSRGKLINSSGAWPPPPVDIADRAYFQALQSDLQPSAILVAPVRSRVTGTWTPILAYKLTNTSGEFLGALGMGVEPANFEEFFASLALGEGATIAMLHHDGTLLARHPHADGMIGRNFSNGPLFQHVLSTTLQGTGRLISPVDGQDRLVSARTLSHFPIVVIATTTVSAALADWQAQTRFLTGVAALTIFVATLILFLIVRQLSREYRWSKQRLALEKQRLDVAVNNMTQGLLLYDSSARLVVCNRRYIELYGVSADVVKPGLAFRDLIAHRKATGSFKGDVDEFCSMTLRNVQIGKVTHNVTETADGRSIQTVNRPLEDGGWVATTEDITERRRSEERVVHLAHYDALTDLPNRVLFQERLEQILTRISRGERLAVLYIDIDEFKTVNDTLGHWVGDELLKALANRLRGCLRETDFVARLGGDEFAIIQTAIAGPTDAIDLITRIYETVRQPFECLGHQLACDASIGVALAPDDGTDLDQLLKNADLAMYEAKAEGRRTYRFFEPNMDARVKERRALEFDLRQAIMEGGFELHYQPLINLRDNKITSCEALLRWQHPRRGMVAPAEFIPIAEETGLITQLGEWVLDTACAEAAKWPHNIGLAINVSPVQIKSQTLPLKVAAALAASGLPARRLELEITEAVLIRDDETAITTLHQLRELGVRIALDDFGTGYSSLSYLQRFPFDKIKIDRCFVKDLAEAGGSLPIAKAVVDIATARNMTTTAEGVETEQQLEWLRRLGCIEAQGYLFSAAKPAAEIRPLLRGRGALRGAA
ncbi:MAG: EAL domain-containing protein [Beijerinckiaceae bacterium]